MLDESGMNDAPAEIRGMFGKHGDSANWMDEMSKFPNGVPRFESREKCVEFMKWYNETFGGSNPQYPNLMHIFTMLISWKQIETILIPNMEKARKEPSFAKQVPRDYLQNDADSRSPNAKNVYERPEAKEVVEEIQFRLNLPIHRCTTAISTMNTLKYLFFHMKCGIYVMIRNGQLRIFAPFVNTEYRNTWGDRLTLEGDGSLDTYYSRKAGLYREENIEKDRTKWWANGNIICNEMQKANDPNAQHWGDHFLAALRDMLGEACNQRDLPDCEFFLNKRDYPQLKVNVPRGGIPVEPYGFIFDKDDRDPEQDVDLVDQHKFTTYAPIVSFYAAPPDRFSDVPWPASEDWEAACGLVFPQTFIHTRNASDGTVEFGSKPRDLFTEANFRKFERRWDEGRVATAFFRGTATGGGTTIHNNQRLKVSYLSHVWKDDEEKGGDEPFLDAAIVGWNLRDKKIAESPMTFLRATTFDFTAGRHHFTPIYEQSKYKYLVYVDGHCAACRYGFMMRLGSVILKVAPRQVADRMWYFPLLKPYVDHVPVKSDLSDLEDQIRWCRANDDKCREIGENAKKFYEQYVGRSALLDYVQMACKSMARQYVAPPHWWSPPPPEQAPPKLRKPDVPCYEDKQSGQSRLCVRCQEDEAKEAKLLEEEQAKAAAAKTDKKQSKSKLRERMRKKERERREKKQKTSK